MKSSKKKKKKKGSAKYSKSATKIKSAQSRAHIRKLGALVISFCYQAL